MDSDGFLLFYKKIFYPNFPFQCPTIHNPACSSVRPDNVDEHSCSDIHHFFFCTSLKDINYISLMESNYLILWQFHLYKFVFLVDYAFSPPKGHYFSLFPELSMLFGKQLFLTSFFVEVELHSVLSCLFCPLFRLSLACHRICALQCHCSQPPTLFYQLPFYFHISQVRHTFIFVYSQMAFSLRTVSHMT